VIFDAYGTLYDIQSVPDELGFAHAYRIAALSESPEIAAHA
jgi:hypothetical protein